MMGYDLAWLKRCFRMSEVMDKQDREAEMARVEEALVMAVIEYHKARKEWHKIMLEMPTYNIPPCRIQAIKEDSRCQS